MRTKHTDQIIVSATARNRTKLFGLVGKNYFENESCVIVESSGQGQIEWNLTNSVESFQVGKKFSHLIENGRKLLSIFSEDFLRAYFLQQFDWRSSVFRQLSDNACLLLGDTLLLDQFLLDLRPWLFVQLVNWAANRLETLRVAACFLDDALENFSVINFD